MLKAHKSLDKLLDRHFANRRSRCAPTGYLLDILLDKNMYDSFDIEYDKEADVLYAVYGAGLPSYCQEVDDIVLIERDLQYNKITGFRIIGLKEHGIGWPKCDYDETADVMYISFGEPQPSLTEEISPGVCVRYHLDTKKPTGITVIGWESRSHFLTSDAT